MTEYTPSELAVQIADEWLNWHRKSDTWRIVDMLRDEVVRLAAAEVRTTQAETLRGAAETILSRRQKVSYSTIHEYADEIEKAPEGEGP